VRSGGLLLGQINVLIQNQFDVQRTIQFLLSSTVSSFSIRRKNFRHLLETLETRLSKINFRFVAGDEPFGSPLPRFGF